MRDHHIKEVPISTKSVNEHSATHRLLLVDMAYHELTRNELLMRDAKVVQPCEVVALTR